MQEPLGNTTESRKKADKLRQFTEALLRHRDKDLPSVVLEDGKKVFSVGFFEALPPGIDVVDLGQGFSVTRPGLQGKPQSAPWTLEDINAHGARLDPKEWQQVFDPRNEQQE